MRKREIVVRHRRAAISKRERAREAARVAFRRYAGPMPSNSIRRAAACIVSENVSSFLFRAGARRPVALSHIPCGLPYYAPSLREYILATLSRYNIGRRAPCRSMLTAKKNEKVTVAGRIRNHQAPQSASDDWRIMISSRHRYCRPGVINEHSSRRGRARRAAPLTRRENDGHERAEFLAMIFSSRGRIFQGS